MGGKGGGGKKGGGGSGEIDVDVDSDSTSTTVLDIVGLDDISVTANSTTNSTNTNRLEVPDPIETQFTVSVPDTIRTDQQQRNEFAITEPIVTQMSTDLDVDVKPVVVDLCLTLGIKDLPRFCLSRPYDRRFAISLFGREVIGFDWCGNSQYIIDDVRPRGFVGGVTDAPHQHGGSHHHHDHHGDHHHGPPSHGPSVRVVID